MAKKPTQQESRIGKKQLPVWVDEETHHLLKGLAHELHTTMESLVVQKVEELLREHGKLSERRRRVSRKEDA